MSDSGINKRLRGGHFLAAAALLLLAAFNAHTARAQDDFET